MTYLSVRTSRLYADMSSMRHMQVSLHYTKPKTHDKKKQSRLSAHSFTIECTELAVAMLTKIAQTKDCWVPVTFWL